jgi:hypothetical protein
MINTRAESARRIRIVILKLFPDIKLKPIKFLIKNAVIIGHRFDLIYQVFWRRLRLLHAGFGKGGTA